MRRETTLGENYLPTMIVASTHQRSHTSSQITTTLVERPLFCDLLAHAPLNLQRGVPLATVKDFKLIAIAAAGEVAATLARVVGLEPAQARNVVATATGMAGAL
jgi:hypothetical protein